MRSIYWSKEYEEFFCSLDSSVKKKIDFVLQVIRDKHIVHSKFVKKLINSPYYEMRISVDNEYRVILFTVNESNFNNATSVYLLNGFKKKSTKDYRKQIAIADSIVKRLFDNIEK